MTKQTYPLSCSCGEKFTDYRAITGHLDFRLRVNEKGEIKLIYCSNCCFTKEVKNGIIIYPNRRKQNDPI